MFRYFLPILLAAGACSSGVSADAPKGEDSSDKAEITTACPVIESHDWTAWIDVMPGPGASPQLHVSGAVVLPTPGYVAHWQVGPADRRMPPAQHLILSFAPPEGVVAQVITTDVVNYAGDAVYPDYRAIIVRCGSKTLAEITDIDKVR